MKTGLLSRKVYFLTYLDVSIDTFAFFIMEKFVFELTKTGKKYINFVDIRSSFYKRDRRKMKKISVAFKKQPVLCIAAIAMLITCYYVRPDQEYKKYFDFKTLACLFCTLEVVCGFARIHTFELAAENIVHKLSDTRNVITAVVFITYIGSMLLANDMALITFLPLGYYVLETTGKKKYMAYTFVLQNIAANLGGMITPFGNPQNLYLYGYFHIGTLEFIKIMTLPFAVALALIVFCCFLVPKEPMKLKQTGQYSLNTQKTILYSLLFLVSILAVLRVLPYKECTLVVTVAMLFLDWKSLKDVNYGLLATFAVFFVFSGNMARISTVQNMFASIIPGHVLLLSVLCCQFFSNVPTAIMLSHFTADYTNLLVAVNLGGLGTPIASLASLITLTEYHKRDREHMKKYIGIFIGLNCTFLIVIYGMEVLLQRFFV